MTYAEAMTASKNAQVQNIRRGAWPSSVYVAADRGKLWKFVNGRAANVAWTATEGEAHADDWELVE